jgi:hypothetical protein
VNAIRMQDGLADADRAPAPERLHAAPQATERGRGLPVRFIRPFPFHPVVGRRVRPRPARLAAPEVALRGASLAELSVVLFLLSAIALVAVPVLLEMRRAIVTEAAAREFGTLFRRLRYRAVSEGRHYGVLFERGVEGWSWSVYRDGNGNGMRARDIRNGRDEHVEGPWRMGERWGGLELGIPRVDPPLGPPPSNDDLEDGDPVRFGRSDLVSFSPRGTSSSGTLYLRGGERSWAVVLYGPSVRVRFWERRGEQWVRR